MKNLISAILSVQEYPDLMLGEKGMFEIGGYILGYQKCIQDFSMSPENELDEFLPYVENIYGGKINSFGWNGLIRNNEPNDEAAFNRFFVLLYQYIKERRIDHNNLYEPPLFALYNMKWSSDLLRLVISCEARPALYLGIEQLSVLKSNINGYLICLSDHFLQGELDFTEFSQFIGKQFGNKKEHKGKEDWFNIIRSHVPQEKMAFKEFYKALHGYIAYKGIKA